MVPLRLLVVLMVAAAMSTVACSARYIRSAPLADALRLQPANAVATNVIVVSIDGLRPDAITAFRAPTLQRLMREGSYSLSASTINPSKTLPSHTSMLTGLTPDRHGVFWNNVTSAERDTIEMPNIFSIARRHGYATAAFFSKAKFQPLQLAGTLDYSQAPGGWWGRWLSDRTMTDVEHYLGTARPNVLFVHMTDPDAAGHSAGWMSPAYGRAVLAADASVQRLIELANRTYGKGQFSLIVTADHGGHGTGHGTDDPSDVTIPWIAWGQGVRPGVLDEPAIQTMDTAATVLWLLGVPEQKDWVGDAVTAAYTSGERLATATD